MLWPYIGEQSNNDILWKWFCNVDVQVLLQGKRISCPTCRARTHVADVAYVDSGRGALQGLEEQSCSSTAQEAAIQVEGSYGTKVSHSQLCFLHSSAEITCPSVTLCNE